MLTNVQMDGHEVPTQQFIRCTPDTFVRMSFGNSLRRGGEALQKHSLM